MSHFYHLYKAAAKCILDPFVKEVMFTLTSLRQQAVRDVALV